MNAKNFAIFVGIFLIAQGFVGLVLPGENLGGVWNMNASMNLLRLMLGGSLIFCAYKESSMLRLGLFVFGSIYLSIFILGIISPSLFGFAPDYIGFSGQVLRLFLGSIAIFLGLQAHLRRHTED